MPTKNPAPIPIEVRDSHIHGLGAFATRPLRTGALIGNYDGRRYSQAAMRARNWNKARTYVFGLSDGSLIDGAQGGNATRHINHACLPNCAAYEVEGPGGVLAVQIEALRPIRKGDELFLDYSLDIGEDASVDYPCRCGATLCRGTMAEALAV